MEKEANQLYRRPQMTGQARDEEEEAATIWNTYPLCVLRDEEVWLHLATDAKQPYDVGVVQFTQHVHLSPELSHVQIVPGEQRLNYDQRLDFSVAYPMSLGEEHIAVVALAWKQTDLGKRAVEACQPFSVDSERIWHVMCKLKYLQMFIIYKSCGDFWQNDDYGFYHRGIKMTCVKAHIALIAIYQLHYRQ